MSDTEVPTTGTCCLALKVQTFPPLSRPAFLVACSSAWASNAYISDQEDLPLSPCV